MQVNINIFLFKHIWNLISDAQRIMYPEDAVESLCDIENESGETSRLFSSTV